MVFPQTPLPVLVEMNISGLGWTNVTADTLQRDDLVIHRGKADEASQVTPSSCSMSLNNANGKYSPRNPLSPYYGKIGRNTPIRVAIEMDPVYDAYSSTSGTGDLSWTHTPVGTPTGVCVFVWQYNTSVGQIASVTYGGVTMERITFGLFALGATNMVGYMYFLNRDIPAGPQTVVVDTTAVILRQASGVSFTGGSHCELEFATIANSGGVPGANPAVALPTTTHRATLINSLFSELDDGSTIAAGFGYTEIGEHDIGTETVNVERNTTGALPPASGYLASWTAASAHWGMMLTAVRAVDYRFYGEVSAFPPRWDTSGRDAWVPIECAGLLRRLTQGRDPADPSLRSFIYAAPKLTKYWPLSGAAGTQYSLDIAPAGGGGAGSGTRFFHEGAPGNFIYGEPMGSDYLGNGMALFHTTSGPMRADVAYLGSNHAIDFVWQTLRLGQLYLTLDDYSGYQWSIALDGTTGIAQASVVDPNIGVIGFSPTGVLPQLLDDQPHHFRFEFTYVIPDMVWTLYIDGVSVDTGSYPFTWNSFAVARFQYVRPSATYSWVNLAHLSVYSNGTVGTGGWPTAAATAEAAQGYLGETAGARLARIAALAGYTMKTTGTATDTLPMGPQYTEQMLTQLRDAETAGFGILAEPRDRLGLSHRTHRSMFNQTARFTLDYTLGQIAPPFEPTDDDQLTRNDVTATRRDGDSFRWQETVGPQSISEPPVGVGRYKDETTVNVETDAQLPEVAGWLVHIGTLDEARFPTVRINLARLAADGYTALVTQIRALDLGDRFTITNLDAISIYDDLQLLDLGYTETLNAFTWELLLNCVPASPYEVISLDDVTSRIGGSTTYGTYLTAGVSTTAISWTVITGEGSGAFRESELWTTAGPFPISLMVGGEEVTLTAVAGTTPGATQTFTVTRSVNGVVKSHLLNTQIRLKRRAVTAL
jgi:hypothetical protein